jgi:hypothetical protein
MKSVATALAASALVVSSLAFADEEKFKAADANGDGALSSEEVMAAFAGTTQEAFGTADADGSGSLSLEEFTAALGAGTIVAQ